MGGKSFIFISYIFFSKIKRNNKKALKTRLYLNNGGEHGIHRRVLIQIFTDRIRRFFNTNAFNGFS